MVSYTYERWDVYPRTAHTNRMRRPLPRWLSCWDIPATGSNLWQWIDKSAPFYGIAERHIDQVYHNRFLYSADLDVPRMAWRCSSPEDPDKELISISGHTTGFFTIRRAEDGLDFVTALDPVYVIDPQKTLVFRNLAIREIRLSNCPSASYALAGETTGIVNDCAIAFVTSGTTYPVYPVNITIDGNVNYTTKLISLPLTGSIVMRYQSKANVAMVNASGVWINDHAMVAVEEFDLWNIFDSWGLLLGVDRIKLETNRDYRARLKNVFRAPGGVTERGLLQGLARDLNLSADIWWDGRSTVNFSTSGITGVTHVYVDTVPQTGQAMLELLIAQSGNPWVNNNIFYAQKENWLPGWCVFLDGRLLTPETASGLAQSGHTVMITSGYISGEVRASYQYLNYSLTRDVSGYVTALTPVSGNVQSGDHYVTYIRLLDVWSPTEDYITKNLLDAYLLPTKELLELVAEIKRDVPIQYDVAKWSRRTNWFSDGETVPKISHLPLIYDPWEY